MRTRLVAGLLLFGCFPTADTPTSSPDAGGAAAEVSKRPFVVNWSPTERTALETQAQDGPVVIAWNRETGDVEVLGRCRLTADPYRFVASSHSSQTMTTSTKMDLGVHFPFAGPVNLGAKLEKFGEINVEYHTIGEYKLNVDKVMADDLEGECSGASHVVVALSVGAFKFFAGDEMGGSVSADVPMAAGASGGASKKNETLDAGGDPEACKSASRKATEPADRCDSVLAIELMAIVHDSPFVAGERWEGNYECTGRKATSSIVVTDVKEDGTVVVLLDFDYADSKGSFVAQGKPAEDGELELAFVEWKDQPGSFEPITPAGRVDPATGEYAGKLKETECADFKYIRRTR
jgi:hypothetical protein